VITYLQQRIETRVAYICVFNIVLSYMYLIMGNSMYDDLLVTDLTVSLIIMCIALLVEHKTVALNY